MQCTLMLHKLDLVAKNYEGLTADEQKKVPGTSCKKAKAYLSITKNNADETETKKTDKTRRGGC